MIKRTAPSDEFKGRTYDNHKVRLVARLDFNTCTLQVPDKLGRIQNFVLDKSTGFHLLNNASVYTRDELFKAAHRARAARRNQS